MTMDGMRQNLAPGLDPRSRRRARGWVAVLAVVLAFGAAAGVALAAAGRGPGTIWPYAVQGPVAAVAFGVPAVGSCCQQFPLPRRPWGFATREPIH